MNCWNIFEETALLPNYGPWNFLVFEKRGDINAALAKQCKSHRSRFSHVVPADVAVVPHVLSHQNYEPTQRQRFDVDNTRRAGLAMT